jgi:peptidase propeptide and YPEB domain protein
MKKQGLLAAMLIAGMLIASPAALAKKRQRTISEDEAARIANSAIQGRVVDVDFEYRKRGRSYYEVEIRKDGETYEVYVDAQNGQLLDMDGDRRRPRERDSIEVYPDRIEVYPDRGNGGYDPHGYYGYYGNYGHGEGYYDDHDEDDD